MRKCVNGSNLGALVRPRITWRPAARLGLSLLGAAAALALSATGSAQDSSPKSFYQSDYAAAPGIAGQGGGAQPRRAPPARPRDAAPGLVAPNGQAGRASQGEGAKKRKMVVNVFVNSLDKEHFNRVVESVIKLHDSRLALIAALFHVGDYRAVTPEVQASLERRGILISEHIFDESETPAPVSPRWEITTKDGLHIAEGFLSLEPFINEWGEYDPQLAEQKPLDVVPGGF